MKTIIILLVVCGCLFLGKILLNDMSSVKYEQSSKKSTELYESALLLSTTLDCSPDGLTDEFVSKIQLENPNRLIARKGDLILIDGFSFKCEKDSKGEYKVIEHKD